MSETKKIRSGRKAQIAGLERHRARLQESVESLKQELARQRSLHVGYLQAKDRENERLRGVTEARTAETNQAREVHRRNVRRANDNADMISALTVERGHLKGEIVEKDREINRLLGLTKDSDKAALRGQIQAERKNFRAIIAELKRDRDDAEKIIQQLKQQLDSHGPDQAASEIGVKAKDERIENLHISARNQSARIDDLMKRISHKGDETADALIRNRDLRRGLKDSEVEVERIRSQRDQRAERIQELASNVEGLKADLQRTRARIQVQKKALDNHEAMCYEALRQLGVDPIDWDWSVDGLKAAAEGLRKPATLEEWGDPPDPDTIAAYLFEQQIRSATVDRAELVKDSTRMVKLGDMVKDSITGYEGIVVARSEYLNGCVSVQVQPVGLKDDGGIAEAEWMDEQRLTDDSEATAGGPQAHPPAMHP